MEPPEWTDRLERRMGDWAIPHVVRGLVLLNALAYLMELGSPGFTRALHLEPGLILAGEFWRAVTFLFVPSSGTGMFGPLFLLIFFLFLWFVGDALESAWGSFKLTLYLLLGLVSINVMSFVTGTTGYNLFFLQSFLFCFASLNPNQEMMLFPLPIPIKVKWLALFFGAILLITFLMQPDLRALIVASLLPCALYILPAWWGSIQSTREARKRRKRFEEGE
ncbi:MAG: hypothetical protein ACFCUX_04895 [Candidatus Methylacidiphilales bacterium]